WREGVWTYGQLRTAAGCVQQWLTRQQVPAGARVALLMRNCPQYVASFYGVMAAGCVAVPLNVQERASVLARQIEHAGCQVVIADPNHPEWQVLQEAVSSMTLLSLSIEPHPGEAGWNAFCAAFATEGE